VSGAGGHAYGARAVGQLPRPHYRVRGRPHNVATSLAHAAPMLAVSLHVASAGYELPARVVEDAMRGGDGAAVRLFRLSPNSLGEIQTAMRRAR
jgi:hypothetical protein